MASTLSLLLLLVLLILVPSIILGRTAGGIRAWEDEANEEGKREQHPLVEAAERALDDFFGDDSSINLDRQHGKQQERNIVNTCRPGNQCDNGGTCDEHKGYRSCVCRTGYGGIHCEKGFIPCISGQPCTNGGICMKSEQSSWIRIVYECSCPADYAGKLCETLIPRCSIFKLCRNGGTCIDTAEGYFLKCICPYGYTGTKCEIAPICITENPCQNGGSCFNNDDGSLNHCRCPKGTEGDNCEGRYVFCGKRTKNPCKNGGTCFAFERKGEIAGPPHCSCREGYSGSFCRTKI